MTNNTGFSARSGNVQRVDALARAMRQAVVRTVRMTALKGNPSMAKTLRSRIAAVAVVALGAGLLQAAPAFAAASNTLTPFSVSNAESTSGNATATVKATQIAGTNNYVSVGFDGSAVNYTDAFTDGTRNGFLTVSGGTFTTVGKANATVDATGTTAALASNTATTNVNVLTPAAGTITVKFVVREWSGGVATDTTRQTITITVGTATVNVYGSSKAYISATTGSAATADDTAANLTFSKSAAKRARITVTQYDLQATPVLLSSGFKTVTASISGVGALGTTSAATGSYMSDNTANTSDFYVYSDGRSGVGTITIQVNGVTVSTKTVTFYGSQAKYTVTALGYSVGTTQSATNLLCVTSTDSAGVAVPVVAADIAETTTATGVTLSETTDSTNCANGVVVAAATSSATAGAVSVSIANADSSITATGSFVVAGKGAVATLTADKATYAPGEKITYTISVTDAKGNVAPDDSTTTGAYSMSTNVNAVGTLPTDAALKNGAQTFSIYAPANGGSFTLSVKFVASKNWDDTATTGLGGTTKTITVKVVEDTTAIDAVKADLAKTQAAVAALTTTLASIQTAISALVASTTATLTMIGAQINKIMKKLKI